MGSNRSAREIKDQHLGTEPKGMEREKAEKPPAVLSTDAAALVAGNRTCLKLFISGRSGSRNDFFTAVLALLSQTETHYALSCPQPIQCSTNLVK